MEAALRKAFATNICEKVEFVPTGCAPSGHGFRVGEREIYVKTYSGRKAEANCISQKLSLESIMETDTIRVPEPYEIVKDVGNVCYLAMELLPLKPLDKHAAALGNKIADMHLLNPNRVGSKYYCSQYGYTHSTFVGDNSFDNTWQEDWATFFGKQRLEPLVNNLLRKGHKKLADLWPQLLSILPKFFEGIVVRPSLIHGDLWNGNVAELDDVPVVYDAGCAYAHDEFDLAMASMFGSIDSEFFYTYHKKIPKRPGMRARRNLYHLFHYLNHWDLFGDAYSLTSIHVFQEVLKTKFPLQKFD